VLGKFDANVRKRRAKVKKRGLIPQGVVWGGGKQKKAWELKYTGNQMVGRKGVYWLKRSWGGGPREESLKLPAPSSGTPHYKKRDPSKKRRTQKEKQN